MENKNLKNFVESKLINLAPLIRLKKEYDKTTKPDKGVRYFALSIEDIIEDALDKHKYNDKKCSKIEDDVVRYKCKINQLNLKIKELQKNSKYCKDNRNPKICKLRIVERIAELKEQIMGLHQQITNVKIEKIKDNNSRSADPNTYYSNEYLPKEF